MNKSDIDKLAHMTLESEEVSESLVTFVANKLSNVDLAIYISSVRKMLQSKTITVESATILSQTEQERIESLYKNRFFKYTVNSKIGGGLVLYDNDTITNASITGQLQSVIAQLEK